MQRGSSVPAHLERKRKREGKEREPAWWGGWWLFTGPESRDSVYFLASPTTLAINSTLSIFYFFSFLFFFSPFFFKWTGFQAPVGHFQCVCLLATDIVRTSCLVMRQALPDSGGDIEDWLSENHALLLQEVKGFLLGSVLRVVQRMKRQRQVGARAETSTDVWLCRFVFCWLEMGVVQPVPKKKGRGR